MELKNLKTPKLYSHSTLKNKQMEVKQTDNLTSISCISQKLTPSNCGDIAKSHFMVESCSLDQTDMKRVLFIPDKLYIRDKGF